MGLMSTIVTLGGLIRPAADLTRVVRGDQAASDEMDHEWRTAVLDQLSAEFMQTQVSSFDRLINGLNRLPRPALALGTLGLFVYAMADPVGFSGRMQGLALVPDQLWWLLGAIVSFYFGARELHYLRGRKPKIGLDEVVAVTKAQDALEDLRPDREALSQTGLFGFGRRKPRTRPRDQSDPDYNAALEDWKASAEY